MPPVLDPVGDQTVDEQTLLTFTATASDPDVPVDTLTFSLSGEPAGALIDPNTGVFTWTPTEAQGPNSYTFDVIVTDDGTPRLIDSETITVTVNEVNVAPVLGRDWESGCRRADPGDVHRLSHRCRFSSNALTCLSSVG